VYIDFVYLLPQERGKQEKPKAFPPILLLFLRRETKTIR